MLLKRRCAAVSVVVAAAITCMPSSRDARDLSASCRVTTINGDVQGLNRGSSCAFLGIPFAAPPVGSLRWKPPQPAAPWAPTTLRATETPSACPSVDPPGTDALVVSEDCLTLNIWTRNPAPSAPAPVLVWIHSGAFQAASANLPANDGRKMAERTGVVVVAANYRLGPFGFLGHRALTAEDSGYRSSGNYGFLDQRAALAWVRDNIAAFGGNPSNVTIAGQSAGAHSVGLHLVSPRSAEYFGRAIMQSGFASSRWRTLAEAEWLGDEFAVALGCGDPALMLACMRSKKKDEVLLALPSGRQEFSEISRAPWSPVVDGLDIPDQPRRLYERGAFSRVPVILGATKDEGWEYVDRSFPAGLTDEVYAATVETEFGTVEAAAILAKYPAADFASPKEALAKLAGDVEAVCEARRIARFIARTRTRVYQYSFERVTRPGGRDHVIHGRDTYFVFGNNFDRPSAYVLTKTDGMLVDAMSGYWARFAEIGDPNTNEPRFIHWPPVEVSQTDETRSATYIVFDWPIRVGQGWEQERCNFWDRFYLGSVAGSVPAAHRYDTFR